jgi:hypothetical protein
MNITWVGIFGSTGDASIRVKADPKKPKSAGYDANKKGFPV